MAAGRNGGYESRSRGFDPESSRRKDYHLGEASRRNGYRRDLSENKFRDSNGRNSTNGFHHNTNNYPKYPPRNKSPFAEKKPALDREPGELSSGSSGSSGSERSGLKRGSSQSKENKYESVSKENKETDPSPVKKRKFSPIVWDQSDQSKQTVKTVSQNTEKEASLPPSPAVTEPTMDMDVNVSVNSPRDPCVNGDKDPGQIDEDELYPTSRTISSSRWAENDEELEREMREKVLGPESGEITVRESSVRTVSRSSSSDREERESDYMEIDGENGKTRDSYSYSDSESELSREETPEPEKPAQRSINMLQGCRNVDEFERLNKINEGTYGVVYRARDKKTGEIVALKKIKMEREREGFPLTSLREINILLSFHHSYVVDVKEVVMGSNNLDNIFMVMEYMEHDLKGVMETMKQPYSQSEVKCLMLQLLEGVKYLHDNWVIHRDLKTSNLLLNNSGELKICDFGMARQYGSPLKPYTQLVVTLWYRAPELLLGAKEYSTAIDMWSVGCIMAELLTKEPLFDGKNEVDQLDKIFKILGKPSEDDWPGYKKLPGSKVRFTQQQPNKLSGNNFKEKLRLLRSSRGRNPLMMFHSDSTLSQKGFDLLDKLLTYDPEKRIRAEEALEHPWFNEVPLPKSKDFMPTFPSLNEKDRLARRRNLKSPDPMEELRMKMLREDLGSRGVFG
ncbi:hypothetical protein LUZ60_004482 [Juncus effusus]|nr:hypothetical protein LUZ60_004482 [Juncus effusus]